jgi:hypothetical protein|tara:strand:+ start:262 stop:1602 length:1341 start_codon:yes stop_codon:yes gene_type:complete
VIEHSQVRLPFASISGKRVEADFDGGAVTSDGGVLLLRALEFQMGFIVRMVDALRDRRHPSYIDHTLLDLVKQRVFQIACGYEDAVDCDDLRVDPGIKAACDRLPLSGPDLASQSTMTRFENEVRRTDLYRIAQAFVDGFIASYERAPESIILDIDDTDDPTHGAQQFSLFNAHYNEHCYMPLHIYEGQSGKLITTILRPGHPTNGRLVVSILKRLVQHLRRSWPNVKIVVRADSKFSSPEVHDFCEDNGIYYVLGQGANPKLKTVGRNLMDQALDLSEHKNESIRLFSSFAYKARSWRQSRRIIYKAEVTNGEANPRFLVTNLQSSRAEFIYDRVYCARGRMEGFIKDHKTFLHSDRTSCHKFEANQLRLFLHSAAYVLLHALKTQGLKNTAWAKAQFNTIQNRFLKIGARVVENTRRVRFHFPTSYPLKNVLMLVSNRLQTAST